MSDCAEICKETLEQKMSRLWEGFTLSSLLMTRIAINSDAPERHSDVQSSRDKAKMQICNSSFCLAFFKCLDAHLDEK